MEARQGEEPAQDGPYADSVCALPLHVANDGVRKAMYIEPEIALRHVMAEHSLHPDTILWDDAIHPFEGCDEVSARSGWYLALSDRTGAQFESSRGAVIWQHDRPQPPSEQERRVWKREDERTARERAGKVEKAGGAVRRFWDSGTELNESLRYLKDQGIATCPEGLREATQRLGSFGFPGCLMIPMGRDGEVVNIQVVTGGGGTEILPEVPARGTSATIGGTLEDGNGPVYVCVDWVTGWTIHEATGCPVVVAFLAAGLLPAAKAARSRYGDARLIIAADNDRERELLVGDRAVPNPGVYYARQAAEAVGAEVAIPDFRDSAAGWPIEQLTFNDLRRTEDLEAVRRWLDPEQARRAVTEPAKPSRTNEKEVRRRFFEAAPFRCLGYQDNRYYYLPRQTGQIVTLSTIAHGRGAQLLTLTDDMAWWRTHWSDGGTCVDWASAGAVIRRECRRRGLFDPDRIRGRGAWRTDGGELLVHLGDRVLLAGSDESVSPQEYRDGQSIYTRQHPLAGPDIGEPLDADEGRDLLRALRTDVDWEHEAAGALLAGWLVLGPFCGVLERRPHVWLTGGEGPGKAAILELVERLLGGMSLSFAGETAQSIGRALGPGALPILYEAGDATRPSEKRRIRDVLRLAASSSRSRGTSTMFLIASGRAVGRELRAQAERMGVLTLPLAPWRVTPVGPALRTITGLAPETGRRLSGRTLAWLRDGRFDETLACAKTAVGALGAEGATGLQHGTLLAGAWLLQADHVPDESEMGGWLGRLGIKSYLEDSQSDGHHILSALFRAPLPTEADGGEATVGELVELVASRQPRHSPAARSSAMRRLGTLGLRVHLGDLHLANGSIWIPEQLRGKGLADSWAESLRAIEGVRAGGTPLWFSGKQSRTTAVPLDIVWRFLWLKCHRKRPGVSEDNSGLSM